MDYKSFSRSLYYWLNDRFRKEFKGYDDYNDLVNDFFIGLVHRGIVKKVFEAEPIEDVCERLLNDEEALEMYFSQAVRCAQLYCE